MPRFSTVFGLGLSQASLDFIDIDLSTDTPLFIDPYAIQIRSDEWSDNCGDHIRSYFTELLAALRAKNESRVDHLLAHLHEPNETFLGVSKGKPRGRGVGLEKANDLAQALQKSRAFESGLLTDISEAELFIYGVGRDTISDLTTNILRGLLADYTLTQCELHGIPTRDINGAAPCWNVKRADWESRVLQLPVHAGRPILLVPKFSVRFRMALQSREFWDHFMIEYLREEYLNAGSGLVHTFQDGSKTVYKKHVKELHPFDKDDLADFVQEHSAVLDKYKSMQSERGPLTSQEMDFDFNERTFAAALAQTLVDIPEGSDAAAQYHSFILGVCTFIFYPNLIYPIKEAELHHGRKRIDIKFSNAAESGFFRAMLLSGQARSLSVPMECKNYSKQMNNPELDQLSSRFSHHRGRLGFLLCRRMDNRERIVARCRDTAADDRGFMIVLEDQDIIAMLGMIQAGERGRIDRFLQDRFDELTH